MKKFHLLKRKLPEINAYHFTGKPEERDFIAGEFDINKAVIDTCVGMWFIKEDGENENHVAILSPDEMFARYRLDGTIHGVEDLFEFMPGSAFRDLVATSTRKLIDSYSSSDHDEEADMLTYYATFEGKEPTKAGDGQFTGGYYQEEYELDGLDYVFSFYQGKLEELEIYERMK